MARNAISLTLGHTLLSFVTKSEKKYKNWKIIYIKLI